MNENLIFWCFFFFLGFWKILEHCHFRTLFPRGLGLRKPCWFYAVRAETLFIVFLAFWQIRSLYDLYRFDIKSYDMLNSDQITKNLWSIPGMTPEQIKSFEIPPTLKKWALMSPFLGSIASILAMLQYAFVWYWPRYEARKAPKGEAREKELEKLLKRKRYTTPAIMSVLFTPVFFIVMNTRSLIRVLAILTGSAWHAYSNSNPGPLSASDYENVRTEEMGLYTMDLELGGAFQYVAVFQFAQLCKHYIGTNSLGRRTSASMSGWLPHKSMSLEEGFKFAGIQGIYAYVILGVLRCLGNFGITLAGSFWKSSFSQETLAKIETGALGKVDAMFTFATILCIYNMVILSKLKDIERPIPMASVKFLGTRALLMILQFQPIALRYLETDSKLISFLQNSPSFKDNSYIQTWEFSKEQTQLAHVMLLGYECLIVVIFNWVAWGFAKSAGVDEDEYEEPLLAADGGHRNP
mmetsp:Transcript_18773/g.30436  ORF Transcript_18773/g.30436 Transcript_18773/m.30436 type:complete len:466 (+) Transcript_18773:58-1455(+)